MIRITLVFMLISGSAFAQTAVQGNPQYKMQPCQDEGNLTVCNLNQITPIDSEPSPFINNIPQGVPGQQFSISQVIACAALTPSGKCVQIKVDEEGRTIVAPDNKSDADKKCPDTFKEYAEGFKKGYIKALEDQKETK